MSMSVAFLLITYQKDRVANKMCITCTSSRGCSARPLWWRCKFSGLIWSNHITYNPECFTVQRARPLYRDVSIQFLAYRHSHQRTEIDWNFQKMRVHEEYVRLCTSMLKTELVRLPRLLMWFIVVNRSCVRIMVLSNEASRSRACGCRASTAGRHILTSIICVWIMLWSIIRCTFDLNVSSPLAIAELNTFFLW